MNITCKTIGNGALKSAPFFFRTGSFAPGKRTKTNNGC